MREIKIGDNEAGKRMDKFLSQYFKDAGMGFLYKMLRKKNITLNGKKATGKEALKNGDTISVFFSDETFEKFTGKIEDSEYTKAYSEFGKLDIIYEDSNILLVNKPAGILTQKAENNDVSLNEWLIGYLMDKGEVTKDSLVSFRPSVCNRLDRNTSGIVICSKSLTGAREMARVLKDRTLDKYYNTIVLGTLKDDAHISGYLIKDEKNNTVRLVDKASDEAEEASRIETSYKVLRNGHIEADNSQIDVTLLEVKLHTGKPHQIRAHLQSIGHPIIGDGKYGDKNCNKKINSEFKLKYQLLHARRIVFPEFEGELANLSGKEFVAVKPKVFSVIEENIK